MPPVGSRANPWWKINGLKLTTLFVTICHFVTVLNGTAICAFTAYKCSIWNGTEISLEAGKWYGKQQCLLIAPIATPPGGLERCNPWPHVFNRHISISQLLSLWRHSRYDVIRDPRGRYRHRYSIKYSLDTWLANQTIAKGVVTIVCQIEIRKMAEC